MKYRSVLPVAAGLLLAATLGVAAPSSAAPHWRPGGGGSGGGVTCPAAPLVASSATTCSFDDEFSGRSLDTSKWAATTTASTGYRVGPECYVNNSSTISQNGGYLHLTTNQLNRPMTCYSSNGTSFQTNYTSGMVSTLGKFSQTYGHFEIRARFPDASVPGLHSALWLYPTKQNYGVGSSGEIDMVEHYSVWPDRGVASLVYPNAYGDRISNNCTLTNPADFHTYSLDWTPSTMTFSYDDQTCWSTGWTPNAPLTNPQPFDKPFFICLTEAMGTSFNSLDPSTLQLPVSMDVDYVRAWK